MRTLLMPLAICLLFAFGCGQSQEEPVQDAGLIAPSPTPSVHIHTYVWNGPTMDLRVFRSDVVARVKPLSGVVGKVETVPSDPGVEPTYRASVEFNFEVVEYLKGSGKEVIAVSNEYEHTLLTREDAQSAVSYTLSERNTTWDEREAVLFLRSLSDDKVPADATNPSWFYEKCDQCVNGLAEITDTDKSRFGFIEWGYEFTDFQIDGKIKAWLPAHEMDALAQSADATMSTLFLTDSEPTQPDGELPTVSLAEIRSVVSELSATMEKGKGIEGFERCVYISLFHLSELIGKEFNAIEWQLNSGLPAGSVLDKTDEYWYAGLGYGRWWLSGQDSSLFAVEVVDFDGRPLTDERSKDYIVFRVPTTSARPLPAGVYEFYEQRQFPEYIPCEFIYPDETLALTRVTVTAPAGAIHESFFDPVTMTSGGIGADKDNGALKPTAFSVNGTDTNIERIKWMPSGRLEMDLKPDVVLSEHMIKFIGLDGKIVLSLDFDDNLGTSDRLSWLVCDQPWKAGDLLMIRIRDRGMDVRNQQSVRARDTIC